MTLETVNHAPLDLGNVRAFSAHPKQDWASVVYNVVQGSWRGTVRSPLQDDAAAAGEELYNHGAFVSARGTRLDVMRLRGGHVQQCQSIYLGSELAFVHDSAITEHYLLFETLTSSFLEHLAHRAALVSCSDQTWLKASSQVPPFALVLSMEQLLVNALDSGTERLLALVPIHPVCQWPWQGASRSAPTP